MTGSFTKTVLHTGSDGRARFRDEVLVLDEGTPQALLSALMPASGCRLRESPVGFRSAWHCSEHVQWVIVLSGEMQIGLRDGSVRLFRPGQHFISADTLPEGARFDPQLHGHWSAQHGPDPLITLFLRL
ncbi:MAG TPA: hypothetical protein VFX09_01745 [Burkholderiales bacterium]|nr:hypothetical protein [Burkholderiales bacterium]